MDRFIVILQPTGSGAFVVDTYSPPSDTEGIAIATCSNVGQARTIADALNA